MDWIRWIGVSWVDDRLEKLYGELDNMVTHVECATKKARAELKKSEPKIDNTSAAFVKKFSPWIRTSLFSVS